VKTLPTVDGIDALLPQTQCTRCGYDSCRSYAQAIAGGNASINQCPPGGAATLAALAAALDREVLPLNPRHGLEGPSLIAVIDEERCIGCARCLPPCPVDAIVGARRVMHTVITALCTGCELCVAPCPVDCIEIVPRTTGIPPEPPHNRARFQAHTARVAQRAARQAALLSERKQAARAETDIHCSDSSRAERATETS
jgi:electron transport complex protein RnfB